MNNYERYIKAIKESAATASGNPDAIPIRPAREIPIPEPPPQREEPPKPAVEPAEPTPHEPAEPKTPERVE